MSSQTVAKGKGVDSRLLEEDSLGCIVKTQVSPLTTRSRVFMAKNSTSEGRLCYNLSDC